MKRERERERDERGAGGEINHIKHINYGIEMRQKPSLIVMVLVVAVVAV